MSSSRYNLTDSKFARYLVDLIFDLDSRGADLTKLIEVYAQGLSNGKITVSDFLYMRPFKKGGDTRIFTAIMAQLPLQDRLRVLSSVTWCIGLDPNPVEIIETFPLEQMGFLLSELPKKNLTEEQLEAIKSILTERYIQEGKTRGLYGRPVLPVHFLTKELVSYFISHLGFYLPTQDDYILEYFKLMRDIPSNLSFSELTSNQVAEFHELFIKNEYPVHFEMDWFTPELFKLLSEQENERKGFLKFHPYLSFKYPFAVAPAEGYRLEDNFGDSLIVTETRLRDRLRTTPVAFITKAPFEEVERAVFSRDFMNFLPLEFLEQNKEAIKPNIEKYMLYIKGEDAIKFLDSLGLTDRLPELTVLTRGWENVLPENVYTLEEVEDLIESACMLNAANCSEEVKRSLLEKFTQHIMS